MQILLVKFWSHFSYVKSKIFIEQVCVVIILINNEIDKQNFTFVKQYICLFPQGWKWRGTRISRCLNPLMLQQGMKLELLINHTTYICSFIFAPIINNYNFVSEICIFFL